MHDNHDPDDEGDYLLLGVTFLGHWRVALQPSYDWLNVQLHVKGINSATCFLESGKVVNGKVKLGKVESKKGLTDYGGPGPYPENIFSINFTLRYLFKRFDWLNFFSIHSKCVSYNLHKKS